MREYAFSFSNNKKKIVCLNFSIGQIWIYPNQTFEFKSHDPSSFTSATPQPADPEKRKMKLTKTPFSILQEITRAKFKVY
jgi:hypothetical protein